MTHSLMRLVVAFMSGLLAALLEPVKFTWRHLLKWLEGLITASALKLALHKKQVSFAAEAAQRQVPLTGPTLRDIPGPTPLPFFGTRWIFSSLFGKYKLEKIHEAYADLFKRYGGIVKEEALWNYPVISISSVHDIEKIIKSPTKFPLRPPNSVVAHYRKSRPDRYKDGGIINEQGELWHSLRTALTHNLTNTRVIQGFIPEVNAMVEDYLSCITKQRDSDLNIVELNRHLGIESTCLMTLGQRMGLLYEDISPRAHRLSEAMDNVMQASNEAFYGLPLWKIFPTSSYRKFVRAEDEVYDLISEFTEPAIEATEDSCQFDEAQSILLGILKRPDLDLRDKKSAIVDFVASGMASIGNSLTLMLYLLAKNPEAQDKLYREITELLDPSEQISIKFLQSAKYLKACIQESFRIYPTAPLVARILDSEANFSGYQVPAGSVVLCHTRVACMDEKNFAQPERFLPERWIPSEVEANTSLQVKSPFLVAPFGFQRRICPGRKFAEQTLQILLAKVVERFELRCESELELQFKFLLGPAGHFSLEFRDRLSYSD